MSSRNQSTNTRHWSLLYRDVRMFTIGGGTAQILRTVVASRILEMKLPQTRGGFLPKE